jgi:hypothetical protein
MDSRRLVGVAATVALLAFPAAARAGGQLGHEGRWLTDPEGRVVILHADMGDPR